MGRGIGFVDVHLLASAQLSEIALWTYGKRLKSASIELNITYKWPGADPQWLQGSAPLPPALPVIQPENRIYSDSFFFDLEEIFFYAPSYKKQILSPSFIMTISKLDKEKTGLLIIDVQEKLMQVMGQRQRVADNITKLVLLSKLFDFPVILTEQYPKWLGPTLPEVAESLPAYQPISKLHFNCCDVDAFNHRLDSEGLRNVIVTGVESHICVFQTCVSILERGYRVHVPQDAVDSRTDENWRVGLDLMKQAGAVITSTETVIYQILKKAGTKEFKQMLKVIK
jgi:nicotinamidase-related amidase